MMEQPKTSTQVIVDLVDVVKSYKLGKITVPAVRGVTLQIHAGEFSAIAGPSGSGKTTLLNMIGCVDTADSGTVSVGGQATNNLKDKELTRLRLFNVGFVFQTFNLISVLSAYQNVEFPLLLQKNVSPEDRKKRVNEVMSKVGLGDHMHHRPNELSGGQRQRVAIARALVTRPALVLADEPTANLDTQTGNAIIDLMRRINLEDKTTFLFSTHDPKVMRHAHRLVWLEDGRVAEPPAHAVAQHEGSAGA